MMRDAWMAATPANRRELTLRSAVLAADAIAAMAQGDGHLAGQLLSQSRMMAKARPCVIREAGTGRRTTFPAWAGWIGAAGERDEPVTAMTVSPGAFRLFCEEARRLWARRIAARIFVDLDNAPRARPTLEQLRARVAAAKRELRPRLP
jgi:hypothetical protein